MEKIIIILKNVILKHKTIDVDPEQIYLIQLNAFLDDMLANYKIYFKEYVTSKVNKYEQYMTYTCELNHQTISVYHDRWTYCMGILVSSVAAGGGKHQTNISSDYFELVQHSDIKNKIELLYKKIRWMHYTAHLEYLREWKLRQLVIKNEKLEGEHIEELKALVSIIPL